MTAPLHFDGLVPEVAALLAAGADPVFGPGGARRPDVVAARVDAPVAAAIRAGGDESGHYPRLSFPETPAGLLERALAAQPDGLRGLCLSLHRRVCARGSGTGHPGWRCDDSMLRQAARHELAWSAFDLGWALSQFPTFGGPAWGYHAALHLPLRMATALPSEALAPFAPALGAIESFLREHGAFRMGIPEVRSVRHQVATVLDRLRPDGPGPRWPFGINHDEDAFAPAARALLGEPDRALLAVLDHCDQLPDGRRPSARWQRKGAELLAAAPGGIEAVHDLLRLFTAQREAVLELAPGWVERRLVSDWSAVLLRGLVWLAAGGASAAATTLLTEVAGAAGRPYAKGGPGLPRVGKLASAALTALEARADVGGPALVRLRDLVGNKPLRARIDALIAGAAERAGLPFDVYLELAVPDHGLGPDRRLVRTLGEYRAEIVLDSAREVRLLFSRGGRTLKTAPAALRRDHADEMAALRATVKAIRTTLAAERRRIDALFSAGRSWPHATWSSQLLGHPVTGAVVETLLWRVGEYTVLPRPDGKGSWQLKDLAGRTIAPAADTVVRLWQPGAAPAQEVAAWRDLLVAKALGQAVKQVFREIYPLTPAERATRTYSNRFAGHVLNYRQAAALLGGRGWEVGALGYWDQGYEGTASKVLGSGGWQATFRYALVDENADLAQYCTTDQVRFARRDGVAWRSVDLAEVPALVLSEALRDVDLAVGVASIAADPTWFDRGEGPFLAYWEQAVDAALSPSAEIRREALARLLPRTRLAGRAQLTDRYLRVHGTLASYRIHLGSANVLIEPENSYLCIVPAPGPDLPVQLPFDDDRLLSLVLSKAFLLLDDHTIDDPTILSQLPRRTAALGA